MEKMNDPSGLPQAPPPDRETDREALEEERKKALEEDDEVIRHEDGDVEVRGLDREKANRGMKRLAEVLRKIKEETDNEKKRN